MELKLPELGEGVHEGELVKWKVKPGDMVKDDQVLCEIMTDKATIELPSSFSGKVSELTAKEGQTVHVGQVMLRFEGAGGAKAAAPAAAEAPAKSEAPKAAVSAPKSHAPASRSAPMTASGGTQITVGGSVTAAPAARKFARESGVDLGQVSGSGPSGRVMKEDIERYINGSGATLAGAAIMNTRMSRTPRPTGENTEVRETFKGLRKKIAEKMRNSKQNAAHFTYAEEADASALVELRNAAKEMGAAQGIKVTYLPFIMKAMVPALRKYPILNSTLDEEAGEIVYKHYYNIGLSVQTDDGLTAPVIKNVESKSILELAAEIQDVVERARNKKLTSEDFSGGTITLTNAGSIGGLFATPIINFPEVAILGFNKIAKKPVYKDGQIVVRDWTIFSMSLDHRIVDGAIAAEFMKEFIKYVENPALLVMESM
jgi:pyruvate dehydrogenase E2 component (dihydrolipoamide acetyltransferase)